jgi:rubrerythrin
MSDQMERANAPDNDDDGAASGLTRAGVLRLLAGSAAASAGLELLLAPGGSAATRPKSKADAHRREITLLQYALSLEYLGATFYQSALHELDLSDGVHNAALALRAHERAHEQTVKAQITKLGGKPHPIEKFDFHRALASETAFLTTSARIEELCTETFNGALALISSPLLGVLAQIVSVEARHAAWMRALAGQSPAPFVATPARSTRASKTAFNKLHLTTKRFT